MARPLYPCELLQWETAKQHAVHVQDEIERPTIFWGTMPAVSTWRIDFDHKTWRRGFNAPALAAYAAIEEESIASWWQSTATGGPFELLDLLALSKACGATCTSDGLHYKGAVQDAAVQIMANVFARGAGKSPKLGCGATSTDQ